MESSKNRVILAQAVSVAILELGKMIDNNIGDFIDLMFYKQGDMTVGAVCYDAMNKAVNMGEGLRNVDVNAIIKQLNGK